MIRIYRWTGVDRVRVADVADMKAARQFVPPLQLLEHDDDNPGCYDAITRIGTIYSFEVIDHA